MSTTAGNQMLVVGAQQSIAVDAPSEVALRFYGPLFGRLTTEVRHTGALTRYIGYECRLSDRERLHFFGIEVERIEGIPDGMVAWEMTSQDRVVLKRHGDSDREVSREKVDWNWLDDGSASGGRWAGEFTTRDSKEFMLSGNAYVAPGEQQAGDDVVLEEHDRAWAQQYAELKGHLESILPHEIVQTIEHIGSTSIEGMPAKPVIDVLIEVPDMADARRRVIPLFNRDDYEYWWYRDHMILIGRSSFQGRRLHHLHFVEKGRDRDERIAFRDHLKSNARDAERYARLKRELATSFKADRERYTDAKSAFVEEVVAKALG